MQTRADIQNSIRRKRLAMEWINMSFISLVCLFLFLIAVNEGVLTVGAFLILPVTFLVLALPYTIAAAILIYDAYKLKNKNGFYFGMTLLFLSLGVMALCGIAIFEGAAIVEAISQILTDPPIIHFLFHLPLGFIVMPMIIVLGAKARNIIKEAIADQGTQLNEAAHLPIPPVAAVPPPSAPLAALEFDTAVTPQAGNGLGTNQPNTSALPAIAENVEVVPAEVVLPSAFPLSPRRASVFVEQREALAAATQGLQANATNPPGGPSLWIEQEDGETLEQSEATQAAFVGAI